MEKIIFRKIIFFVFGVSFSVLSFSHLVYSQSGWIAQTVNAAKSFNDVFFINSNTGWAVGDTALVFKTTNGGINWVSQYVNRTGVKLFSVRFINPNTGFAAGSPSTGILVDTYFFKTTNGGMNWNCTYSESGHIYFRSIFPIDENIIYAAMEGSTGYHLTGGIYVSTNGGSNFTELVSRGEGSTLYFINANTGWACTYYADDTGMSEGCIMQTTDAGFNWTVQYADSLTISTQFHKIQFLDLNTGYAIGSYHRGTRLFKTSDGGANWVIKEYSHDMNKAMFFLNPSAGWIGGMCSSDSVCLSYTSDGGAAWNPQKTNFNEAVQSIYFIDKLTGWMALSCNNILKTVTGGIK
ncbi:MAG: YCF48-related protein [Ignavibacteria bacterium]|nr:YCF48-related protein [Ignavibacteria bacterium]